MKQHPSEIFFDEKMAELSKRKCVIDIGGGTGFQKGMAKYKSLFVDNYESLDMPGMGADIEGDIHAIPLETSSVDGVLCNAVLEHVLDPIRAVQEIHRVLTPGGAALVQVPSTYPYHGNHGYDGRPGYGDYWRFFQETLEYMFKDFSTIHIMKQGGYFQTMVAFSPIQFLNKHTLRGIASFLDTAFRTDRKNTTSGYIIYAEK